MTAIVANTLYGPMLVPPYDTYVAQALIRLGQYAPEEFATWKPYLPVGGTVLDVGANIGGHTLAFAYAVGVGGRVIAFEPQRMLHHMLCGSLAILNMRHVDAKLCACARENGSVRVPPLDYGSPGNFGGLELKDQKDGEPVPAIAIDTLQLQGCDFIKIDVEGAELNVLHGARETIDRLRPVISAEADRETQVPALLGWFKFRKYRAWWHRPPLGPLWPNVVSVNLLALPRERELPEPQGHIEVAIP